MNLSLKKLADDEACATQATWTVGAGVEHPFATANAQDAHVPDAASGAASGNGRQLLREASLGSLALAESHGALPSVFDGDSTEPVSSRVSQRADLLPAGVGQVPEDPVLQEKIRAILARAQARSRPPDAPPDSEPELVTKGGRSAFQFAWLALAIVLVVALGKSYWGARDRVATAEVAYRAHEAEWTATAQELQKSVATQSITETIQRQLATVSAERAKPRWVPVLRSVATCAGVKIEVREVRASEKSGAERMWTMLLGGVSKGSDPRVEADRYRADLQRELDRMFPGRVSIRFERFEDLPGSPSAAPGERQGKFTMTATIHFDEAEQTGSTGGS